jgi:hypothetical protein
MKRLLLIISVIFMISCNKGDNLYKSSGVIYGIDPTMWGCCGGWLIEIDKAAYHFDTIPENSNFSLIYDSLPIPVKLDWQVKNTGCPTSMEWITIQRIRKE